MASILILYSSVDGHTVSICRRIAERAEGHGHDVTLSSMDSGDGGDPAGFDRVVIGASIRYGKHRPNVLAFVERHAETLSSRPGAFFTVNLVARKPNRNTPDTNPYLKKFLQRVSWKPQATAVFAGKLNYALYGFLDTQMIRLIMWLTKGPTNRDAVVDFTDWDAVDAFADRLSGDGFDTAA
jgi:menaquinone-dependent protoporphyrinogen oxidase